MTAKSIFTLVLALYLLPACSVNYNLDYSFGDDEATKESNYIADKATSVNELLVFGPQPEEADLEDLAQSNVQKVISFRTPKEIEEMDYNQRSGLEALGIEYANIPIGGDDHPYSPAAYQSLLNELGDVNPENGQVLLHCKSGWRASVLGVAYLVKHDGMPVNEAVKYAEGWWPLSLEKVLDTEFELREKP